MLLKMGHFISITSDLFNCIQKPKSPIGTDDANSIAS